MPVVFRDGGFRYFFFSNEGSPREPPHIHVKRAGDDAKVLLEPESSVAEGSIPERSGVSSEWPDKIATHS